MAATPFTLAATFVFAVVGKVREIVAFKPFSLGEGLLGDVAGHELALLEDLPRKSKEYEAKDE